MPHANVRRPPGRLRAGPALILVLGLAHLLYHACSTGAAELGGRPAVPYASTGGMRRSRSRGQRYTLLSEKSPCAVVNRRYVSSPLEQTWYNATRTWQTQGNGDVRNISPYCELLVQTTPQINKMLSYIRDIMASNTTLSAAPDADEVLSSFVVTLQCGPYMITQKEHIESLVAALRHPFSIKCPPPFDTQLPEAIDIFDASYVMLASWAGQFATARHKYYLDAGAGIGYRANGNQHWMIETYAARGIELDRALFWEATPASGATLLEDVPASLFPAFAFYNIPAPRDLGDGRNPLNVVTRLAKPDDFLSVKLDIDQPEIENHWLRAILGTGPEAPTKSVYATLIDELFWEHHFNFVPMQSCCWGPAVDERSQLADSFHIFMQFRELGIRSHYWQ